MSGQLATLVCLAGILGLFLLDRDRKFRTSPALWVPAAWLAIDSSRALSQWLAAFGLGPASAYSATPDLYMDGSPVDRAGFIILMVLGLIVLAGRRHKVVTLLRTNGPLLVFFFYCFISFIWSDFPDVTLKRWIKAVGDLLMVMIVLTEFDRLGAIKRVLAWVGFLLLPFSVLFIKYFGDVGRGYSMGGKMAYVGVTTNKNLLGMITLIFGLACVWRLLLALEQKGQRKTGPLVAQSTLLIVALWLLWKADSATSLACFALASGVMLALSLRRVRRRRSAPHFLVAAALTVSLLALFVAPALLSAVGRDSTLTGRTQIWSQVLAVAGSPWVGTGFESFWLGKRLAALWNVYYFHLNEAHNGYLEFYITLGWIGLALFGAFMVKGYRSIVDGLRSEPDLGRLRLAYFVVALIYNCTESATRMGNPIWIMLLLVVMTIPAPSVQRKSVPAGIKHVDDYRPQPELDNVLSAGLHREDF